MAGEDKRYTDWLRTQPCARCQTEFRIEVHHPLWGTTYSPELPRPAKAIEGARKGKGQKSHDHYGIPLCIKDHVPGIHRGGGSFSGMTPDDREAWEREQIALHRQRYAMQSPEPIAPAARTAPRRAPRASGSVRLSSVLDYITTWSGKRHLAPDTVQALSDLQNDLSAELGE